MHVIIQVFAFFVCRLRKLIDEFYTYVTVDEVAKALDLDNELVDYIHSYWILKRKVGIIEFIAEIAGLAWLC